MSINCFLRWCESVPGGNLEREGWRGREKKLIIVIHFTAVLVV